MDATFQKINTFQIRPGTKILKAKDYAILLEAQELLEQARKEAERLIQEAKEAYEEKKEQGYQDGLMEGKMEMAQQMMANVANAVNYFASIEQEMVSIVMEAIKKVIGSIPSEELIVDIVKNGLAAARNQRQVTVRVSPQEVETVKARVGEILGNFSNISFVDVVSDPRLGKGGCIIESEIGTVDASIDVQLTALERAISKSFKSRGDT